MSLPKRDGVSCYKLCVFGSHFEYSRIFVLEIVYRGRYVVSGLWRSRRDTGSYGKLEINIDLCQIGSFGYI